RKPLVAIAGRAILDRQLDVLRPLFDEILLVANDIVANNRTGDPEPFARPGLRVVCDRRPGLGPLAGLEAALVAAAHEQLFLVAGDMPALDARAIDLVLSAPPADAAVIVTARGPEPLHARYARAILPRV